MIWNETNCKECCNCAWIYIVFNICKIIADLNSILYVCDWTHLFLKSENMLRHGEHTSYTNTQTHHCMQASSSVFLPPLPNASMLQWIQRLYISFKCCTIVWHFVNIKIVSGKWKIAKEKNEKHVLCCVGWKFHKRIESIENIHFSLQLF